MKLSKLRAASIAAGVAVFAFIGAPASAGAVTIPDGDGVDFDAACVLGTGLEDGSVPEANNIESNPADPDPGGAPAGDGCEGVSTYDGLTESTDLTSVTLESVADATVPSDVALSTTWVLQAPLPAAGPGCDPQTGAGPLGAVCADLPNNSFVGFGFKTLFQSPADQNNLPTTPLGGGCARVDPPGGEVRDQHGHWLDGYHHFIGFDAVWTGVATGWTYSVQVGTYDPSPDGAFFFTELGTNNGVDTSVPPDGIADWKNTDPAAQKGTHWNVSFGPGNQVSVSVDGVVPSSNSLCAEGVFNTVYARANDPIVNIKGLSTADSTFTSPVTIPLSLIPVLGESDVTSVGGFIFFSDITLGNSANKGNGLVLATLSGDNPDTECVHEGTLGNRLCVSYTSGALGGSDTLGDSPACPTPTFGGTLQTNPLLNWMVGCQYDDDNRPEPTSPGHPDFPKWTASNPGEEGTFFPEWWDTDHSITA